MNEACIRHYRQFSLKCPQWLAIEQGHQLLLKFANRESTLSFFALHLKSMWVKDKNSIDSNVGMKNVVEFCFMSDVQHKNKSSPIHNATQNIHFHTFVSNHCFPTITQVINNICIHTSSRYVIRSKILVGSFFVLERER